jgi:hypothetical protein
MKKLLLSVLAVTAMAAPLQADELKQPYSKLKKQIDIMSKIISTSLSDGDNVHRSGGVNVSGVYLKSQGVVFEIDSARGIRQVLSKFGHDSSFRFTLPERPIIAVKPIKPVIFGDDDINILVEEGLEQAAEAYEEVIEAFREQSEHTRELREEQRELAYEMRNYARRKRDMEFEMRHADGNSKDLKENLGELEQEIKRLELKNNELNERAEKEESQLKQKQQLQQDKLAKAKKQYFARLDTSIAETLCDYGAGLRQLAKNERVTFIIDVPGSKNISKKIHSFTKKNIISCIMEDKTSTELLKSAESYYF